MIVMHGIIDIIDYECIISMKCTLKSLVGYSSISDTMQMRHRTLLLMLRAAWVMESCYPSSTPCGILMALGTTS